MKKARVLTMVIAVLAVATGMAVAAENHIQIPRTSHAPRLADFENAASVPEGVAIGEFTQRYPQDGAPATQSTVAYLSYDNNNIYAVFVCKDNPKLVRAHLTRRDQLDGEDNVSISLDTFHDRRHAFMFSANPLGVQADAISAEGMADDYKFDAVWYSEGKVTADGYIVVLAIPFRSLRFEDSATATWGIAIGRYVARSDELATWPHLSRKIEAWVPQFATMAAFDKSSHSHGLRMAPYAFFSSDHFLETRGPAHFTQQNEARMGLDGKYVVRDQFTFDFTVNPDFSQVESDEPQVTVNQRYEVFFPERRPFFTESAGFFETPETLFFSRRIVDPAAGIRFTGRVGRWTLGALTMQDRAPGRVLETDDPRFGKTAPVVVGRGQYKVSENLDLGVFLATRSFSGENNRVLSADLRWKPNANWVITGQATQSTSVDSDGSESGNARLLQIEHAGSHLNFYSRYRDRSPEFQAALGFIPRTDVRQWRNSGGYRWRPKRGLLTSYGPSLITNVTWNTAGELQDSYIELPFWFNFKGTTSIAIARTAGYDFYRGAGLSRHSTYVNFSTEQIRCLGINVNWEQGTAANFFPASGRAPFIAASTDLSASVSFKPTPRLRMEESYIYSRIGAPEGFREAQASFNNHILRTKLNYFVTRRLSLRAIVDYNSVLPNPVLTSLEHQKHLGTDFLVTYFVHPGTAIHVGYSDGRENRTVDPRSPGRLRDIGGPDAVTGRKLFVKVSYSFEL